MAVGELMSAQEIAARIGVTERTVRRWIKSGDLSAARRGRSFEIDLEDARALAPASTNGHKRSSELAKTLAQRERELAILEGRYLELSERYSELREELQRERGVKLAGAQPRKHAA